VAVTGTGTFAIRMTAAGDEYDPGGSIMRIHTVWHVGATTPGHTASIQAQTKVDGSTSDICRFVADRTNFTDVRAFPGPRGKSVFTFSVKHMDSGEVWVYLH